MAMTRTFPSQIPASTRQVGEAILDPDDLCLFLGQHLEDIFGMEDFADLYADSGRPSVHPILLAVVTLLQFWEDWPDRQAGEQVVKRIDWKYGLRQELTWLGFHFSDLCYFRQRLLNHAASERVFERVLSYLTAQGYLKKRGKQRTDSTHVLGQVARLSRVELKWESLRMALEDLMSVQAGWVMDTLGRTFVQTYSHSRATYRMSQQALHALETQLDADSLHLLQQVESAGRVEWRELHYVRLLAAVVRQQTACFTPEAWMAWEKPDSAPLAGAIQSPHEPEARYSEKRGQGWVGYKTHLTESIEPEGGRFITDVLVTLAHQHDSGALARIQARLIDRDVCPCQQYVDQGYMSAAHIARSADLGIDLRGEVQAAPSRKAAGFRLQDFAIDVQGQVAHCPAGKSSTRWTAVEHTEGVAFRVGFGKQCRSCVHFSAAACTTQTSGRGLDISAHHAVLQARRQEQQTPTFRQEMKQRAGIEGTISEAVRAHDLRHNRYRGLDKTQFQAAWTATAINLKRLMTVRAAA
jgi:transposase